MSFEIPLLKYQKGFVRPALFMMTKTQPQFYDGRLLFLFSGSFLSSLSGYLRSHFSRIQKI